MVDNKTIALACDGDFASTDQGKALRELLTLSDVLTACSIEAAENK